MARDKVRIAFRAQRRMAGLRGIKWRLTYGEWLAWWEAQLGLDWFSKRGRKRGQYCMARIMDKGPYQLGNIKSILSEDNALERKDNGTLLFGEKHGMCKLSAKIALAVYKAKGTKSEIAKQFAQYGVSRFNVANIKDGSNWRRVTGHKIDK